MRARLFDVAKDQAGSVLVEFTLVLPVLMFLVLGLAQFGMIFYNYILVTNAAATGARQFSISRRDSTPYTDTVSTISSAASISGLAITLCCQWNGMLERLRMLHRTTVRAHPEQHGVAVAGQRDRVVCVHRQLNHADFFDQPHWHLPADVDDATARTVTTDQEVQNET